MANTTWLTTGQSVRPATGRIRPISELTGVGLALLATWTRSRLVLSDDAEETVFFVGNSGGEKDWLTDSFALEDHWPVAIYACNTAPIHRALLRLSAIMHFLTAHRRAQGVNL